MNEYLLIQLQNYWHNYKMYIVIVIVCCIIVIRAILVTHAVVKLKWHRNIFSFSTAFFAALNTQMFLFATEIFHLLHLSFSTGLSAKNPNLLQAAVACRVS